MHLMAAGARRFALIPEDALDRIRYEGAIMPLYSTVGSWKSLSRRCGKGGSFAAGVDSRRDRSPPRGIAADGVAPGNSSLDVTDGPW